MWRARARSPAADRALSVRRQLAEVLQGVQPYDGANRNSVSNALRHALARDAAVTQPRQDGDAISPGGLMREFLRPTREANIDALVGAHTTSAFLSFTTDLRRHVQRSPAVLPISEARYRARADDLRRDVALVRLEQQHAAKSLKRVRTLARVMHSGDGPSNAEQQQRMVTQCHQMLSTWKANARALDAEWKTLDS